MNRKRKGPTSASGSQSKFKIGNKDSKKKTPTKVTKAVEKTKVASDNKSKQSSTNKKSTKTPTKVSKSPPSTPPVLAKTNATVKSTSSSVPSAPKTASKKSTSTAKKKASGSVKLRGKTITVKEEKTIVDNGGQKRGRKPKAASRKSMAVGKAVEVKVTSGEDDDEPTPTLTPKRGRPRLRPLDDVPSVSQTKKETKKPVIKKEVKKEENSSPKSPSALAGPSTSGSSKTKPVAPKKTAKSRPSPKKVSKTPVAQKVLTKSPSKLTPKKATKAVVKTEDSPLSLSESSVDSSSTVAFSPASSVNSKSTTSSSEVAGKKVTKKKVAVKKVKKLPPSKLTKTPPNKNKSSTGEKAKVTTSESSKSCNSKKKISRNETNPQKKGSDDLSKSDSIRGRPKTVGSKKKLKGTKKKKKKAVLPKRSVKKPRQASLNASAINRLLTESVSSALHSAAIATTTIATTPSPTTTTTTSTSTTPSTSSNAVESVKSEKKALPVKTKKVGTKRDPDEQSSTSSKSEVKSTKKGTISSKTKKPTSSTKLSKKKEDDKDEKKKVVKKDTNKKKENIKIRSKNVMNAKGSKGKKKAAKKRPRNLLNASAGDRAVEIIDTRRCKRMASLNASAMMAATYLPETRIVLRRPDADLQAVPTQPPISSNSYDYRTSHIIETIEGVVRQSWQNHLDHETLMSEDGDQTTETRKTTVTTTVKRVKLRGGDTVLETISTEYAQQQNFRQPTDTLLHHHLGQADQTHISGHHLLPPVAIATLPASSASAFTPCSARTAQSTAPSHSYHSHHIGANAFGVVLPSSNASSSVHHQKISKGTPNSSKHQSTKTTSSSKRTSTLSSSRSKKKQQVAVESSTGTSSANQSSSSSIRIQVESSSTGNAHNSSLHNSLMAANNATIFAAAANNAAAAAAAAASNVHQMQTPIITNFTPGALFSNNPYISQVNALNLQQQQQSLQQQATTPFNFFLQTPQAAAAAAQTIFPTVTTVNPFNPQLSLINFINGSAYLQYQNALAQQNAAAVAGNAFGGLPLGVPLLPSSAPQLMHFANSPTQGVSTSGALFSPYGLVNQQQQQQQLLRSNQQIVDQQLPFLRLQPYPSATVSTIPSASIATSMVQQGTGNSLISSPSASVIGHHQNLLHQQQQQHHHQLGTPGGIIHRPVAYHAQTGHLSTTTSSPATILTHHQPQQQPQPIQNASIFSGVNSSGPVYGRVQQLPVPNTVAHQTFQLPIGTTIVGGSDLQMPAAATTTHYSTLPQSAFLTQGAGGQIVQQQQPQHLLNFSNQSVQPQDLTVEQVQQQPQPLIRNGQTGNAVQGPQIVIGPAGGASSSNGTKKKKSSQSNGKDEGKKKCNKAVKGSSEKRRNGNGHQQHILPAPANSNSHINQLTSLTQNIVSQNQNTVSLNPSVPTIQPKPKSNRTNTKSNDNRKPGVPLMAASLKRKLAPMIVPGGPKNLGVNGTTAALVMVNGTSHPTEIFDRIGEKLAKTGSITKNSVTISAVIPPPNGLLAVHSSETIPLSTSKRPRLARPAARAAHQLFSNGSNKTPQPKVSIMLKKVVRSGTTARTSATLRPNGSLNGGSRRSRTKSPSPNLDRRRSKSPSVGRGISSGQSGAASSPALSENSTNSSFGQTPPKMVSPGRAYNKKRNNNQQQTPGKILHGWTWQGEPVERLVYLDNEETPHKRKCYSSMKHIVEGETIAVRDCVLLKSGPNSDDIPYLAKITALWEKDGEMMMSLLWYYRPEYNSTSASNNGSGSTGDAVSVSSTETEKQATSVAFNSCEVFASKHRDVNSVACIDDKCYVLTYNEFCRFKRERARLLAGLSPSAVTSERLVAPWQSSTEDGSEGGQNSSAVSGRPLPPLTVSPELVFYCRRAYDFRQKRILKNSIPFSYRSSAGNLSE